MGNTSSATTDILNEIITDLSTRIYSSEVTLIDDRIGNLQELDVGIEIGKNSNCNINIAQTATIRKKTYQRIDSTKKNDIQKKIANELKQTLINNAEQILEGIPFGSNEANFDNFFKSKLYSDLSTTISNEITNNINSQIESAQRGKIWIKIGENECAEDGTLKGISIAQNIDITASVDQAVKSSQVNKLVSEASNIIDQWIQNDISQELIGIGSCCGGLLLLLIIFGSLGAVSKKRSGSWNFFKKGSFTKKVDTKSNAFGALAQADPTPVYARILGIPRFNTKAKINALKRKIMTKPKFSLKRKFFK